MICPLERIVAVCCIIGYMFGEDPNNCWREGAAVMRIRPIVRELNRAEIVASDLEPEAQKGARKTKAKFVKEARAISDELSASPSKN